jgi:hypothetical protein
MALAAAITAAMSINPPPEPPVCLASRRAVGISELRIRQSAVVVPLTTGLKNPLATALLERNVESYAGFCWVSAATMPAMAF